MDVDKLLNDSNVAMVTTMIDFYGLPNDFPGRQSMNSSWNAYEKVKHLQRAFEDDIGNDRFQAFLTLHEFESLLFSDVDTMIDLIKMERSASRLSSLQGLGTPELINLDNPPSKRIKGIIPEYRKTLDGLRVAQTIGLANIRNECPHFDEWLTSMEERFCLSDSYT